MGKQPFTFESLCSMDGGRIAQTLEFEIAKIVGDLNDRPTETSARKVTLQIEFVPVATSGTIEEVKVSVQISRAIPSKKTRGYSMGMQGVDKLTYNDDSRGSVRQSTLDERAVAEVWQQR